MMRASLLLSLAAVSLSLSACGSSDSTGSLGADDASDTGVDRGDSSSTDTPASDTHANVDSGKDASPTDGKPTDAPADAPADTPTGPFDPRTWTPSAKGLWIWYFAYTGLTPAEAATRAQKAGVGYVLIKSGQDASFWSSRYTAPVLAEFTSRGMHVFAWPYITPSDIPGSIDAVVQAIDTPGTDGIVLDVEVEFEGAFGAEATSLCKGIRAKRPKVWLGFTSFGWPQYHTGFPWKEFDADCGDVWMPQSYWTDRGVSWTKGYDETVAGTKSVGVTAPMWMIQSNDDIYGGGGAPSTTDLNAFFDKAGAKSMLWELPAAGLTSKLNQLDALHWKNP